jgi:UDP-2-acetamido-2-deoxy-ribo-hexuluronate aminotransferase
MNLQSPFPDNQLPVANHDFMKKIELVDLKTQHSKIETDINTAIQEVLHTTSFINGPAVKQFKENLSEYLGGGLVVPCANGTDALQIAMMALDLQPGDEVILPAFTYAATAEVIGLMKLVPRFIDVEAATFNIDPKKIEEAVGPKTKAIVPVHLFGQSADMEPLLKVAKQHQLFVIEDSAQAIGTRYIFGNQQSSFCGLMGDMGATSFFPSKNLGCYGDGGAIFTNNQELAKAAQMIANHGQSELYYHDRIGVNSRLDSIQAAILNVKLKHLNEYTAARQKAASAYDERLAGISQISIPFRSANSTHVFHQYTLTITDGSRENLKKNLIEMDIPCKVYYPVPLHFQKAYNMVGYKKGDLPVSENLCNSVISLPMHTELEEDQINYICDVIQKFYKS